MSAHAHAQAHAPAQSARPSAPAARAPAVAQDDHRDVLRLDLRDVPYNSPGLHIESMQPSWFSRFLGLFIR